MIEWKIKGLFKADAEAVYEEITSLGEEVTPEQVVEFAKDKNTELHKCFEWDNRKAAHKYRIAQAQSIFRNIAYVKEYADEEGNGQTVIVRAITCTNERKNTYETIERCIENPESFARLQASMLKDLTIFTQRYERYASLKAEYFDLFDTIHSVTA
jgi:hypothetical protein